MLIEIDDAINTKNINTRNKGKNDQKNDGCSSSSIETSLQILKQEGIWVAPR